MAYNPQMPQQAQQMPQQGQPQGQQQWQNPAANWQRTYQNSQWARQAPQYQQMPYQQNQYQRQMPQQMPQQYQQFQMPQFSPQQINQFLSYMQSRPMPNFMGDPRYQAQQSQRPVYQPTQSPAMNPRAYVPTVRFEGGMTGGIVNWEGKPTVGDATADAWVRSKIPTTGSRQGYNSADSSKLQELYKQYYAGAQ